MTTEGLLLPYGTHEMPQRGHISNKKLWPIPIFPLLKRQPNLLKTLKK
jgi:hypothetical protein